MHHIQRRFLDWSWTFILGCTKSGLTTKIKSTAGEGGETEIQHGQDCHNRSWGAIGYFQMDSRITFLFLNFAVSLWYLTSHLCLYTIIILNMRFYHPVYHYSLSLSQNFCTPCYYHLQRLVLLIGKWWYDKNTRDTIARW